MKKVLLISALLLLISLTYVSAQATFQSSVTFPAFPQSNRPFIWMVSTNPLAEPSRVSWIKTGTPTLAGSFTKISSTKWFCFFADDQTATCGPTPFAGTSGDYSLWLSSPSISGAKEEVTGRTLTLSNIANQLQPAVYNHSASLAYMLGSGYDNTASVQYTILSATDLSTIRTGFATYDAKQGRFVADFSSNPLASSNKYFVVFDITKGTEKGGSIRYFETPQAPATPTPITSPNVTVTPSPLTSPNATISPTPTPIQPAIVVPNLEADQASINTAVNQSDDVEMEFNLKNPSGNYSATNITAVVPPSLASLVQILFSNNTIYPNSAIKYTVRIRDIQESARLDGKFTVNYNIAGNSSSLDIPITVRLDVVIPQKIIIDAEKPLMDISPTFFSKTITVGKVFSDKVLVKNMGNGKLGKFSVEYKGLSKDLVKVELPSKDIDSGDQANIRINASPQVEQKYTGSLLIKSNGGEKEIGIDLEVFGDITTDINTLQTRITEKASNSTTGGKELLSSVADDLSTARKEWEAGHYKEAKAAYSLASGKFDSADLLLSAAPASSETKSGEEGGLSGLLIPIVIIIIIAGLAAFVYFKKIKAPKAPIGEDDEYAESGEEYSEGK